MSFCFCTEQFLKLTERRRGERELLEQIYLRKFAAKIERRRAASARRRERRQGRNILHTGNIWQLPDLIKVYSH